MTDDRTTAQTDFTICNSQLVAVPYSTVLRAIELTDSDPFRMRIRCPVEWAAIAQGVNQGIDSHLEAICSPKDVFDNGNCSVTPHSLCVLLRRLGDTEVQATDKHSAGDIWDAAMSLQTSILTVLGIDEYGRYVGREAPTSGPAKAERTRRRTPGSRSAGRPRKRRAARRSMPWRI